MRRVLLLLSLTLFTIIIIVLVRTFSTKSKQATLAPLPALPVSDSVIKHLQQAIQFKTISYDDDTIDKPAFTAFNLFLQKTFPVVHRQLRRESVNNFSQLFYWKGKNPSAKPIILMAHLDVVPVEQGNPNLWRTDPFGGEVKEGFVYGRGAIDDKGSLMAILEAIERLLNEGFQPLCDIYVALGHDEEINGESGAGKIAALLKQRNIHPAFVLDEGGEITLHEIPGIHKPVALVGIAEKGYLTLDMTLTIPGGHSSMPAKETAIDQLAKAIVELKEHPFPATLNYTVNSFMDYMGPEMPFVQRMAFANRWLFSPVIKRIYSGKPGSDAMIRTTTALTIFQSGVKENVIPSTARATVNFRTLPGFTANDVIKFVKKITHDERIQIKVRQGKTSPDAVANVNDPSFKYLLGIIRGWQVNVLVTPYLVLGATDGRYFTELTKQVYRFVPFTDVQGFHGMNEKVGIEEYKKAIAFYYYLIKKNIDQ